MTGLFLGLIAIVLLGSAALCGASLLRPASVLEHVLAAYVLAYGAVISGLLLLSTLDAVRRTVLLPLLTLCSISLLGIWWRKRPESTTCDRLCSAFRSATRPRVVHLLTLAVASAVGYVFVLIASTPPVTWDSLRYHLFRAAMWRQQGGVGYIEHAYDERMNANPPNAEIALTFALEITRDERFAALVQFSAWLACAVAIAALARQVGFERSEALFGALLFVLLPIVALQASTTHNDLFLGSLLLAASVFVLRGSGSALPLAAVATALAVGTKVTALFGVPLLLALAAIANTSGQRARRIGAVLSGATAGAYWYAVNLTQTGRPLGDTPDTRYLNVFAFTDNALAAYARVLDALEVTGVRDWGGYVYASVAIAFLACVAGLVATRRIAIRDAAISGSLVLIPLLLFPVGYLAWRVFAKVHHLAGSPAGPIPHDVGQSLLPVGGWEGQTLASEDQSWFGPIGILLVLGVGVAALVLVRKRKAPLVAAVLALAPLVWLVEISAVLGYDVWQGRFFMYPVGLSAALWGLALRRPPVAWATVTVAVTIAALSLALYDQKPLGKWHRYERWELLSAQRPGLRPILEHLEKHVPIHDRVALALGANDWGYPAFGPRLTRHVVLVPFGSSANEIDADWLFATGGRATEIDRACWSPELATDEGSVFRRRSACGG